MTDFSHLASPANRAHQADIPIEGLAGMRPVLTCRPATEDNPAYFNAFLKRTRAGRKSRGRNITAADIAAARRNDIVLLAEHCVIGWDTSPPTDADGEPVAFSVDACKSLFEAIVQAPGGREIFDEFRAEVTDPTTFDISVDPDDLEAQAGNSPNA